MALYILVHHKSDPNRPYVNGWLDSNVPDPTLLDFILQSPSSPRPVTTND